ncbi:MULTISPECIES: hypothetical protein [unclassified Methylobacterium]|uniref:hypothetical protein n=1 Tax=unclassified Methylobacterium TaxID=2615210 RepID=UPI0016505319
MSVLIRHHNRDDLALTILWDLVHRYGRQQALGLQRRSLQIRADDAPVVSLVQAIMDAWNASSLVRRRLGTQGALRSRTRMPGPPPFLGVN